MLNFAKEVHASVMSPVWKFVPRRAKRKTANKKEAA
jgi:nitrogenase molybdenum-cofactor synthesis protein NifE